MVERDACVAVLKLVMVPMAEEREEVRETTAELREIRVAVVPAAVLVCVWLRAMRFVVRAETADEVAVIFTPATATTLLSNAAAAPCPATIPLREAIAMPVLACCWEVVAREAVTLVTLALIEERVELVVVACMVRDTAALDNPTAMLACSPATAALRAGPCVVPAALIAACVVLTYHVLRRTTLFCCRSAICVPRREARAVVLAFTRASTDELREAI